MDIAGSMAGRNLYLHTYEDHMAKNIRWHAYRSTYDSLGHLIHKEGYGSGNMGSKETYVLQGDKIVEMTTERPGTTMRIRF
jgi:hypothetical protein